MKVKRYFEIAIQTDDRLDETGKDLCAESKSLTSTQAGDGNVTAHAQPISLDMSPIKQIECSNASRKTTSKPENVSLKSWILVAQEILHCTGIDL